MICTNQTINAINSMYNVPPILNCYGNHWQLVTWLNSCMYYFHNCFPDMKIYILMEKIATGLRVKKTDEERWKKRAQERSMNMIQTAEAIEE